MYLIGKVIKKKYNRYVFIANNTNYLINTNNFNKEELDKLINKEVFLDVDINSKEVIKLV